MSEPSDSSLMVSTNLPPQKEGSLGVSLNPAGGNTHLNPQQIEDLLSKQVEILQIGHIKDNCCGHQIVFKDQQQLVDITLTRKSGKCCGLFSETYEYSQHSQKIAEAKKSGCCHCCGKQSWHIELTEGSSIKSEQLIPGHVHQFKGLGVLPANTKAYQKKYTIQHKNEGHYYCCFCCTEKYACCQVKKRKNFCPFECMDKGGMCYLCCCIFNKCCCPGQHKKGCCPWGCMYGEGGCSICCYCCVSVICPVTLEGAHNYVVRRTNCPFCCCNNLSHIEFDPEMTSIDKYSCMLQSTMMR